MKRSIKGIVSVVIVLVVVGGAAHWYLARGDTQTVGFSTGEVTRATLQVTIDATGTLEPEEVIDVGAQVSGKIVSFGNDTNGKRVDYGSSVEKDAVMATIDDVLYQADVSESEAAVQSAQAGVQVAEANLTQLKAKSVQAERDWQRAQKLGSSEALAQTSYDSYQSEAEIARANVAVGEATILQAKASLAQAESGLWRAKRNLGYCTIVSPVTGIIIDRRVNIGQTVAASLDTPSLFLIAKDLQRMQVWVAVNEADVARIKPGQAVTFTVDALPDETFQGEVVKVRLNASMTQNVVTYTVEIATNNPDGRLLPYLTANVAFEVSRRDDVLRVPAGALRWRPTVEQVAPEFRSGTASTSASPEMPAQGATAESADNADTTRGIVWVARGQYVQPIPVRVGLSDGTMTEVSGEGLTQGTRVVTGTQAASSGAVAATPSGGKAATDEATNNPFAPKLPKPPKGGGGGPPPS